MLGARAQLLAAGLAASVALAGSFGVGCQLDEDPVCGPSEGMVVQVIDGDTIALESGERIRYLLVDTPEVSGETPECFGPEATEFNRSLVEGKTVQLSYDNECTDRYDRLLAYIEIDGRSVNEELLSRGYACVLQIDPNGIDREDDYRSLEEQAEVAMAGMWSMCEDPCG